MKRLHRFVVLSLVAGGLGLNAFGASGLSVSSVTARQRYPWNGKVDIAYEVSGELSSARRQALAAQHEYVALKVTALDRRTGRTYLATTLEGEADVTAGRHELVWDMGAQGLSFVSDQVAFSVTLETAREDGATYCIVDLSDGPETARYPVTYRDDVPAGGWGEEYKTTKLVLRRIEPGTFVMGSPVGEIGRNSFTEVQHRVSLSTGFYMGVFEVTQRQWELVMGTRPSYFSNDAYYATRPVERVSYDMIRGRGELDHRWPESREVVADTFVDRLQRKSGLALDLPTEAQWEYACRAGTTNVLNNGKALYSARNYDSNLAEVGRFYKGYSWPDTSASAPTNSGTAAVGSFRPNAWGLYDMHGNVWEWCLDWSANYRGDERDPQGPSSIGCTGQRVVRGGSYDSDAFYCRSAARISQYPDARGDGLGFRLARSLDVTLTLDTCGGTPAVATVGVTAFGTVASPPRVTREGYGLVGWYTEPSGGGTILREETQIPRDMTLYAYWLPQKYCVIDLSAGADAASYPVTYLDEIPEGGWGDDYKTTKLVLSRLPAGSFLMGSPTSERGRNPWETQHQVTLTKPFYMGVFEVTQRQWELVMGTRPSYFNNATCFAKRPVENLSYPMLRGTFSYEEEKNWPTSVSVGPESFFGRLRARTGLHLDLPTEAQWEYACRASTTNALNCGHELAELECRCRYLDRLARYTPSFPSSTAPAASVDLSGGTAEVGSYRPNAWGLYDMHGNVDEMCLDWNSSYTNASQTDPVGKIPEFISHIKRGGSWSSRNEYCRSAARHLADREKQVANCGFRIAAPGFVTVRFDGQGGTCEAAERRVVQFGRVVPPRVTREGYGLVGWYTEPNGGGTILREETQIPRDMTLYAYWLPQKYCVIDLSAGADAASYPVTYFNEMPEGGWGDDCKTTKLVLSRLPSGSFLMGSPTNEYGRYSGEILHRVTLTRPFYMGVFEVTQRQWELVMGTRPSRFRNDDCYAKRPVENLSYPMLRGPFSYEEEENWPTSVSVGTNSFFGRLRARTGLHLDLPTEAQWEYACRAGTTTALNSGKNLSDTYYACSYLNRLARYRPQWPNTEQPSVYADASVGTAEVGSYRPNAWGLYDMHGNVFEMCLDWYDAYTSADRTDPVGKIPEFISHVARGGSWDSMNEYCRSAYRRTISRADQVQNCGFRIAAPGFVTVRLDLQGGTCGEAELRVVQFGTLTPPRVTREGYGLVGWYTEPNGGGTILLPNTQIARDTTFYAYWIPQKYCVIDLSGGADATNYPVTYFNDMPDGGWSDDCKTTKLVLSRLPAGSFLMGSPTGERGRSASETQHRVTLTKPFYLGVFEVTQRQWELVMGTRPSYFNNSTCYAKRPVENVSYPLVRGTSSSDQDWPTSSAVGADSFFGRLRARTGLPLDLPTEAQWEYACRASTTNAINSGKELTEEQFNCVHLDKLACYTGYRLTASSKPADSDLSAGTAEVGGYRPNPWGLYDMHGNVDELCLDWYGAYPSQGQTDPVGSTSHSSGRVKRGGNWLSATVDCRSASRFSAGASSACLYGGVRVALSGR